MAISHLFKLYSYWSIVFSISFILVLILASAFLKINKNFLNSTTKFLIVISFCSIAFLIFKPEKEFLIIKNQNDFSTSLNTKVAVEATKFQNPAINKINISYNLKTSIWLLILFGFLFFITKYCFDIIKIRNILARAFLFKKIGKLKILISDELTIPVAVHLGKFAYILMPNSLVMNTNNFRLALLHELQHHRQKDTLWVHLIYFIKAVFFWNPIIQFGISRIHEIQELACDEHLVGRKDVSIREYCSCLLEVATSASSRKSTLAGTTSMLEKTSAEKLKERINSMSQYHKPSLLSKLMLSSVSLLVISSLSYGASLFFQEDSISLEEAKTMLGRMELDGNFPVEINEAILKELNFYLANQDGKEFIETSLDRKSQYKKIFDKKFKEYKAPRELLAAALAESGFQNLPQEKNPVLSAGIWQFIPSTARNYGLRVDKEVDERLDIEKETDAALRYLSSLNFRFKDWRLALLAYNAGENKVQEGIDKTGSRDPWLLIKKGYGGDSAYLSKVMACVLILKNRDYRD